MADDPFADIKPAGGAPAATDPFADIPAKGPSPPANTTASGVAASAARGLAPYAAGAALGAAAGAPFGGVGAVPGAAAGIAATGLTELGGTLYNAVAPHIRWPHIMTPQGATDRLLDAFGIKRPSTTIEHMVETATGMAPLGAGSARGAVDLGTMVLENRAGAAGKYIEDAYERAIRPTVVGKGTAQQIDRASENVASALSSIVGNKAALRLADKSGKEVVGRLPQTLDEFVQAIAQTKRPVFDRYDALAREAEGMGVKIDPGPAVNELRKFASDPSFNLPKYDAMRQYATETADRMAAQGALPPTVAQSMVRNLNEGLTAFYRASSPEAASRAAVDDLVANQLRKGVDASLESAGLPGYQEARNAYGALKAIESEVAHRAIVYGRRDPGGGLFGRLGSIASYEELARFATSFDPAALASAAAIRGGRALTERLHSPNRAIKKMFEKAEDYHRPPSPAGRAGGDGAVPTIPPGMQPPRPGGPGQETYTGPQTPQGALMGRGGSGQATPLAPTIPPGVQPARPSGAGQEMYSGPQSPEGVLLGRGGTVQPSQPVPAQPSVIPIGPFNPTGGGRVSLIDPDDGLARALRALA